MQKNGVKNNRPGWQGRQNNRVILGIFSIPVSAARLGRKRRSDGAHDSASARCGDRKWNLSHGSHADIRPQPGQPGDSQRLGSCDLGLLWLPTAAAVWRPRSSSGGALPGGQSGNRRDPPLGRPHGCAALPGDPHQHSATHPVQGTAQAGLQCRCAPLTGATCAASIVEPFLCPGPAHVFIV